MADTQDGVLAQKHFYITSIHTHTYTYLYVHTQRNNTQNKKNNQKKNVLN